MYGLMNQCLARGHVHRFFGFDWIYTHLEISCMLADLGWLLLEKLAIKLYSTCYLFSYGLHKVCFYGPDRGQEQETAIVQVY